jgi:hypothetical protein
MLLKGKRVQSGKPRKFSYIELQGAYRNSDEFAEEYSPRNKIALHPTKISFFTDHLVVAGQYKLIVMETYDEIKAKIKGEG